jgi:hypothetical protein
MTCLTALTHLDVSSLGNFSASIPSGDSWPSLLQLRIDTARINANLFPRLIASLPSLRALHLSNCSNIQAHWLTVLGGCNHLKGLALWLVFGASDSSELPLSLLPGLKALRVANMPWAILGAVEMATSAPPTSLLCYQCYLSLEVQIFHVLSDCSTAEHTG